MRQYVSHLDCRAAPRTHAGCDDRAATLARAADVSIHAPTWGATLSNVGAHAYTLFESTHPRGVRPPVDNTVGYQWPLLCFARTCINDHGHP
jgi:hypothetical protein